jgi:glycerol-3-phosphate cytidylyltransferase
MKTVITYGTFDLFHVGHVNLLKRARELGDRLVVAVSTDEFNLQEKNKTTIVPYEHRVKVLESCRYVDLVIPESSWSQKERDILEYQIDTFIMGDDWEGKFDELKTLCNVVYLPRTKNISSTAIKQAVAVITQLSKELT